MQMSKKATALKYSKEMSAPLVLLNGRANIAEAMLNIAEQKNIPVVYEPETQEILSLCKEGQYVPEETWAVLAKVFAFIRGQLETVSKD